LVEPLECPLSSYIHTQFVTADENSSVAEAVKVLQSKDVEIILVTVNGKYVGIVTDSDILEKVVMKGEDSDLVFLKSIMTSPIITLPSSSTVRQAIKVMRTHKIKHLPVTDSTDNDIKNKIIGTVTQQYLAEIIRIAVVEKTFRSYRQIIRFVSHSLVSMPRWVMAKWLLNYPIYVSRINLLLLLDENVFLHVQSNNEVNI
jgi:trk system potassium uptake protein